MASLQGYLFGAATGALGLIAAALAGATEEDQGLLPEGSITARA
jgi:hypothetical protein